MSSFFDSHIRPTIRKSGIAVLNFLNSRFPNSDETNLDELSVDIFNSVKGYTATSLHRVDALITAVKYLVENEIEGAFVECGVWRGGSIMAVLKTLQALGRDDRDIYLYDTYNFIDSFSEYDISHEGERAEDILSDTESASYWSVSLEEVRNNVFSIDYPRDRLHFVVGKVEDTIPAEMPDRIALLRLDTDFYTSTRHELVHLYPLLSVRGVLIVDDYGHWQGAKKAADEYLARNDTSMLLNRIDYSGRMGIKLE